MDSLAVQSPDGVRSAFKALEHAGAITVERRGQARRVTIRATGARTTWSRGRGRARPGAAYTDGWETGQDAVLLRLAREGLDLATMADRLGRTPSSVRHRLHRLRAARTAPPTSPTSPTSPQPPAARGRAAKRPATVTAPTPLAPVQKHIITTANRPEAERAQIAAFLAAGKARKLPPAYVGEVRHAVALVGLAPISPLARRLMLSMDGRARCPADLAKRGRLDPQIVPDLLREARDAGLVAACHRAGRALYRRAPGAEAALRAMGLTPANDADISGTPRKNAR